MSLRFNAAAIVALVAVAVLAIPGRADAQARRRHRHSSYNQYWTPPGSTVRVFPIPPQGYHYGGVHVYQFGASSWPYGYPQGYRWPYGSVTYSYPAYGHRYRLHHWRR